MNELTMLAATYFAHLFSDLVFDPADRYNAGNVYISLISTNIVVQLILIMFNSVITLKFWCRKR